MAPVTPQNWVTEADRNPCTRPPPGWRCTREGGHPPPCAAERVAVAPCSDCRPNHTIKPDEPPFGEPSFECACACHPDHVPPSALPPMPAMTVEWQVTRLCALMAEVNGALPEGWERAADCICEDGKTRDPADYRNDGTAIEWIERVVRERMKTDGMSVRDGERGGEI